MSKEYTYKHTRIPCTECKTNEYTVYDHVHDETYCMLCGTVLIDNTPHSITQEINNLEKKVKFIRDLWKKKK